VESAPSENTFYISCSDVVILMSCDDVGMPNHNIVAMQRLLACVEKRAESVKNCISLGLGFNCEQ
jgi:hypothetical protein